MPDATKKEIIEKMEAMGNGASLAFRLGTVFGAGLALVELNPAYPQKGQKKYLMRWGKEVEDTRKQASLLSSDKAKVIAGWISDRAAQWIS
jgi:hypothetical protein